MEQECMTYGVFVLTFLTALGAGVVGGVFFAFSTFVMKALARIPAAQAITAMQSINIVVINPWFMVVFLGTGAGCLALAVWSLLNWSRSGTTFRETRFWPSLIRRVRRP